MLPVVRPRAFYGGDRVGQEVVAHRRVRPLVLVTPHRQQNHGIPAGASRASAAVSSESRSLFMAIPLAPVGLAGRAGTPPSRARVGSCKRAARQTTPPDPPITGAANLPGARTRPDGEGCWDQPACAA